MPGISLASFGGLSVPAGTPAAITKKIGDVLHRVLAEPQVRAKLEANGSIVAPSTPQEFADDLKAEIALTDKLMKAANIGSQ